MKRILCAILAVLMLCTMTVAMVSCGASVEKMEENCKKLKEDGEIGEYMVADADDLKYVEGAKAAISATSKDGKYFFSAIEYNEKDDAVKAYEEAKKELDEMEAAGEDITDYIIKRSGNVVISSTSKDLYKKIV